MPTTPVAGLPSAGEPRPVAEPAHTTPVRPLRIVVFGTYDVRAHPRGRVLLEGLRARGEHVAEANAPLGLDTSWRVRILKRPWLAPVLAARVLWAWVRLAVVGRKVGRVDAVVVPYLGHLDVHLARRMYPRAIVALDHLVSLSDTARDRGAAGAGRQGALALVDQAATRTADIVVVDTDEQRSMLQAAEQARAVVVPVGAPAEWFQPPVRHDDGPLRVIFFGLYTPLQGATVIARAIGLLTAAPIVFTMCGRGQEYAEARALARTNNVVEWRDWVDAEDLPGLVAGHDVCLGIFGTGSKALRVVPNKVYQGAAAGCAVVTSDTRPQRIALDRAGSFVPPGDHEALARALLALADDRDALWRACVASSERAAACFRPEEVVRPLHERLVAAVGR